ncbi:response regulator [Thermodesulfobacterium hydrogeniphilum]|uniref:response regulator n=1 Tax=Thermodesulfobacterium hydrogeniphilum TaxID=161156 RepID=UPI0006905713|nr:response regulator [Thermodesulfobacterium hydrogeniphilum]
MIFLALSEKLFNKIKDILETHKIKYKLIEDGESLLKLAKKEKPELIILEKDIPLLDGFATTLLLKSDKDTQDIPIVAICKSNFKEEEIKAKDSGCDEIINCPIDEEKFWEKIEKYLKKK